MKKHKTLILSIVGSLIIGINFGGAIVYFMYKSAYNEMVEKYNHLLIENQSSEKDYNTIKEDTVKLVKSGR